MVLVALILLISSCTNGKVRNTECSKFSDEIYPKEDLEKYDFDLDEQLEYYLSKFEGSSIKGSENEAYQMIFYSTHNYGKLIKIENSGTGAIISVKCIELIEAGYYCAEGDLKIDSSDWNTFQSMIYEFNYWTENQIEINTGYLDGSGFLLEGNRPEATKCGKKNYNLAVRGNPEYDKIAALCEEIIVFEDMMRPPE